MATVTTSSIYQTLPPRSIRLVTLEPGSGAEELICSLTTVALDSKPLYDALSYCWEGPTLYIKVHGQPFPVRSNAYSALLRLRHPDRSRTLWIDSISINQEDDKEKSKQVALMKEIFGASQELITWLGEAADDSDLAMDTIVKIAEELDPNTPLTSLNLIPTSCAVETPNGVTKPKLSEAINLLSKRPYFTRVWIVQEVFVPRGNMTVMCGSRGAPWDQFGRANLAFTVYNTRNFERFTANMHLRQGINDFGLWAGRQEWHQCSLLRHAWKYRQYGCTNPKDRLYAFLGISVDQEHTPQPDYTKTVQEIYSEFAAYFIRAENSLRILSLCNIDARMEELPSWVPDWSINSTYGPVHRLTKWYAPSLPKFSAGKCTSDVPSPVISSDNTSLTVQGIQCFTISEVSCVAQEEVLGPATVTSEMWHRLKSWQTVTDAHIPDPYPTGESRADVHWRTILTNTNSAGFPADPEIHGRGFYLWCRMTTPLAEPATKETKRAIAQLQADMKAPSAQQALVQFFAGTSSAIFARRLFVTKEHYMGLAPKCAQVGDRICIIAGCEAPFVLRKALDLGHPTINRFLLVGECYCHGIMEGEMMAKLASEDSSIRLEPLTLV